MRRVFGIHNRPNENDCYDEFAAWCVERGYPLRYENWKDFEGCEDDETTFCMMQDPVGRWKAKRLPDDCINHPKWSNSADRRIFPITASMAYEALSYAAPSSGGPAARVTSARPGTP